MIIHDSELEEQGISVRLLGLGANSWTKDNTWKMLDHFRVERSRGISSYSKI